MSYFEHYIDVNIFRKDKSMLSEKEMQTALLSLKDQKDWEILSDLAIFNDVWFALFDVRFDKNDQLNIIDDMDISDEDYDYTDAIQSADKYDLRKQTHCDTDRFEENGIYVSRHIAGCKLFADYLLANNKFTAWRELRMNDALQIIATCEIIAIAEIIKHAVGDADAKDCVNHYLLNNVKYSDYINDDLLKRLKFFTGITI